jgi:hypothetical protein
MRRRARALTDRPISASSPAAWAAVPRRCRPVGCSRPVSCSGGRSPGVGGVPAGWAGWRRRWGLDEVGFGLPARGADGGFRVVRGGGFVSALSVAVASAARFALRRCGRRRGRAPSTSEGRCSLTEAHDGAPSRRPSVGAVAMRLLGKSVQALKPPLPSGVYIHVVGALHATTGDPQPLRTGLDAGAGNANRTQPPRATRIVDFKKYSV